MYNWPLGILGRQWSRALKHEAGWGACCIIPSGVPAAKHIGILSAHASDEME